MKVPSLSQIFACFLALAAPLLLSNCASSRPIAGALIPSTPDPEANIASILVSTNRLDTDEEGTHFTGERGSGEMRFGGYSVAIPPNHEVGQIERPRFRKAKPKPDKHILVADGAPYENEAQFRAEFAESVRSKANKDVAIFVHGYNTLYAESLFVSARMVHDTDFDGTMLLFSWPSRGKVLEYVYDRDSMFISRDALARTIQLAAESGAEQIYLVAHSMGCMLTMETLRQAKLSGDATFGGKLEHVMLASPDISIDVFKSQIRVLDGEPDISVLVSRDDKALAASQRLAGNVQRVGNFAEDHQQLASLGVVVIDLTELEGDALGHSKFAQVPELFTALVDYTDQGHPLNGGQRPFNAEAFIQGGTRSAEAILRMPIQVVGGVLSPPNR